MTANTSRSSDASERAPSVSPAGTPDGAAGSADGAGPAPVAPPARRRRRFHRAPWIGLAIFCVVSVALTQSINRFAPGNAGEARAMGSQLEQRFGKGKVVRLEATMRDRVKALWSDELPATATIYVSGERADPASQVIYSCRFVRVDGSWRLEDLALVVDPKTGAK
jgi:hypothetical protein